MSPPTSGERSKRCPKCRALLRAIAEFCPHCGLSMPGNFPHNPVVSAETSKVVRALKEDVVPPDPTYARIAARYLILVARDRRDVFEYFQQKFLGEIGVEVRYERRATDRRQRAGVKPLERRRRDRRTRAPLDAELRRFGFGIVRKG